MVTINLNDVTVGNGTTAANTTVSNAEVANGKIELYAEYDGTYGTLYTAEGETVTFAEFTAETLTRAGYTFAGFYSTQILLGESTEGATPITSETEFATANNDTVIYAYWTANTNTRYTVNHYLEKVGIETPETTNADHWELAEDGTEEFTNGTTDANVTPAVKSYEGFTSPSTQTVTVKADGTTVVNYYYTRNQYAFDIKGLFNSYMEETLSDTTGQNTFNITIEGVGGVTAVNDRTLMVDYGAEITINNMTLYAGYTYAGYSIEGESTLAESGETTFAEITFEMYSEDVVVTLNFAGKEYEIVYELSEGQNGASNPLSYETSINEKALTIAGPTKEGYEFTGWSLSWTDTEHSTTLPTMSTGVMTVPVDTYGSITLTAQWEANEYTITLDQNSATTEGTKSVVATYDSPTLSVEIDNPERTGHTFLGWTTGLNTGDVVIGTDGTLQASVEGYTDESGNWILTSGTTLYASWRVHTYTIRFHANTGSGEMDDLAMTYGIAKDLPANTFEKAGFTFQGWARTEESTSVEYVDEENVIDLTTEDGAVIDLYAVWIANTNTGYKIEIYQEATTGDSYELEDTITRIDGTTDEALVITSTSTSVTINEVTYAFDGFTYNAGAFATNKTDNSTVVVADGSLVVKVYFDRIPYTLTIDKQEGVTSVKVNEVEFTTGEFLYGASIKIDVTVSEGYTWNGFAVSGTEPTGFDAEALSQTVTMGLGNATLTAQATIRRFTLTIDPASGVYEGSTEVVEITQDYNTTIEIPNPSKTGYVFDGWELSATDGSENAYGTFEDGRYTFKVGNDTLTATWHADRYMVTLDLNDVVSGNGSTYATSNVGTVNNGKVELYVTYDTDYSEMYVNAIETEGETAYNIDNITISRDGYTFNGFYTERNILGAETTVGDKVISTMGFATANNETVLYAYWTANENTAYKVYHRQVNVGVYDNFTEENSVLIDADDLTGTTDSIVTPATKTYVGFVTPDVQQLTIGADGQSSITYYYARQQYSLTLELQTGVSTASASGIGLVEQDIDEDEDSAKAYLVQYGANITLAATSSTGYSMTGFTGYAVDNLEITEENTQATATLSMPSAMVQLVATATANRYVVKLNVNAGADEVVSANVDAPVVDGIITLYGEYNGTYGTLYTADGTAVTLGSLGLQRDGHAFEGWFTTPIEDDASTADATEILATTKFDLTTESEIFAYWSVDSYTLTVKYVYSEDSIEGIAGTQAFEDQSITVKFGAEAYIDSPVLYGYTADQTRVGFANMPASNETITVVYTANPYTISYVEDGGTISGEAGTDYTTNYTKEVGINLPSIIKVGYTFAGWQVTTDFGGDLTLGNWELDDVYTESSISAGMYGNVTLTATWTVDTDTEYKINIFRQTTAGGDNYEKTVVTRNDGITDSSVEVAKSGTGVTINDVTYAPDGFTYEEGKTTSNNTIEGEFVVKADGTLEIDVYFSRNPYNLTINKQDGIESVKVNGVEFTTGEFLFEASISIEVEVAEGYTWNEFAVSGTTPTNFDPSKTTQTVLMGIGDTVLTAQATIRSFTLTIDPASGLYNGSADEFEVTQNYGSTYAVLTPVKEGYKFIGWNKNEGFKGNLVETEDGFLYTFGEGNDTLTATWQARRYAVNINLNDVNFNNGSTSATFEVTTNEDVSLNSLINDGILTLYATYDSDYATLYTSENGTDYVQFADLLSVTREGYNFVKFSSNAQGTDEILSSELCDTTTATTIYAIWSAKPYTLTVEKNLEQLDITVIGATIVEGTTNQYTVMFDTTVRLTASVYAGYHFNNWTIDEEVKEISATYDYRHTTDSNVAIRANVVANTYIISYDPNGGEGLIASENVNYGESVILSNGDGFSKEGYTLTGWTYDGTNYALGASVNSLTDVDNGEVVMMAVWTPNDYVVTFETNLGSAVDNLPATYDQAVEIVGTTNRAGYNFVGWSTTNGTSADFERVADIGEHENLTAYLIGEGKEGGIYLFEGKYYVFNLTSEDNDEVVVYAIWTVGAAQYKVEYYLENVDNDQYTLDATRSKFIDSVTGTEVEIEQLTIEGFVINLNHENTLLSGVVTGDSSLVLRLYYTREIYTVDFVTPRLGVKSVTGDGEYKFGANVSVSVEVSDGYELGQITYGQDGVLTSEDLPYEFEISSNMTFVVTVTALPFEYNIRYNFEKLDGTGYETDPEVADAILSAKVDTEIKYDMISEKLVEFDGFTYESMETGITVKPEDNATVVNVYYSRNNYTLTLQTTKGVLSLAAETDAFYVVEITEDVPENEKQYSVRYGAEVNLIYDIRDGFEFDSWSSDYVTGSEESGFVIAEMPFEDLTIYINTTTLQVEFTVHYHLEKMSSSGGSDLENDYVYYSQYDETKQGYTDEEIESVDNLNLREIPGFTYSTFASGVIINGDKSTVLDVYYLRNSIDVDVSMTEGIAKVVATVSEEEGAYAFTKEFTSAGTFSVKYGAKVVLTYELVKVNDETGYSFAGWTGGVQEEAGTYYIIAGTTDFNISATATNNPYTITFYGNGGQYIKVLVEGTDDTEATTEIVTQITQDVVYNRSVVLTKNVFTRTGYIFQGWSTDPEGEVEYTDEQEFVYSIIGDLELYAVWTPIKYNVEYNANGGDGVMTGHTDIAYGQEFDLNENQFTLTGHTFNGWSYEADDTTTKTISKDATTAQDLTATNGKTVTLYAVWLENKYTLTYNSNYSSVTSEATDETSDPETYGYTADILIKDASATSLEFAVTGYKFVGWSRSADGSGTLLRAGETVNGLTADVDGEVVLYAVWTPITYSISFANNGGSGEMATMEGINYDVEVKLTKNTFTKIGYDFAGWTYQDDTGASHDLADEETVKNLTATDGEVVILTAKWTATEYSITYLPNAGTFDSSLQLEEDGTYETTFTIEDDVVLIAGDMLTKVGHTLIGYSFSEISGNWAEKVDGDIALSALTNNTISKGVYGDVKLQAKWSVNSYTLTINYQYADGDEAHETYTEQVPYGLDFNVASPEIEGYTASPSAIVGTMDSVDGKTYLVVYNANVYDLTFNLNDAEGSSRASIEYTTVKVVYDSTYADAYVEVEGSDNLPVGLPIPERQGYQFAGWYLTADLNDADLITEEMTVKITENTTLFAKWTANTNTKFTVEYKFESLDGQTYELRTDLQETITDQGTTDTPITEEMVVALTGGAYPTIAGFKFEAVELATITADGNAVVTVKYERDYFTLTLSVEDGVGEFVATTEEQSTEEGFYIKDNSDGTYSVRYEATVVLNHTISDNGYDFAGYVSDEIATITDSKFEMIAGNVEITATTDPKPYTITFHGNDGMTADGLDYYTQSGAEVVYKAEVTLTANLFLNDGYTFRGWALSEEDADNRIYDYAEEATFVMTTYSANVDLYAVWRPIGYDLTLEGDAGVDISKAVVTVNGEKIVLEDKMLIDYDSTVRVYYTYTDENGTSTVVKGGYDFVGFKIGDDVVGTGEYYEFIFHGNTTVVLTSTPRDDTRFKVVYQTKDLVGTGYTDVDERIVENGTTDKAVTYGYLNGLGVINSYEGFVYTAFEDQDGSGTVTIKYGNDTEEGYATTIYIKYDRLPYKLTLVSSEGVRTFVPVETIEDSITAIEGDYQVYFETPFNVSLEMFNGYSFDSFTVEAEYTQGSVSLGEGTKWTLTAGEDGYYYGDTKVLGLVYDEESGMYVVDKMPAYNITITTSSSANTYQIIYHRNLDGDDEEKTSEDVVYNTAYTIKHANTLTWSKPGYSFMGWANSEENAAAQVLQYEFDDLNDLQFSAFNFYDNVELWAVWSADDNYYTIEYYFETLDGQFEIDSSLTKTYTGKTDEFVEYEAIEKTGYEFDADNEDNVLSGNILPDDALVLKVYYTRIWYTLTVNFDAGISAITAESDYIREENLATSVFTAEVKHGATVTLDYTLNEGYDFAGYEEESSTETDVASGEFVMPISDISINVLTTPKTYTLTFKGNGGTFVDETDMQEKDSYTQEFAYLTSSNLTPVKFELEGYTFKNWTITVDAETVLTLSDGELFAYNYAKDLEAVANWDANPDTKYTVNYYAQKIDGTYEMVGSAELQGYTNSEITDAMVQEGFAQIEITREGYVYNRIRETEPVIAGDGSTVVNVEYNLASFNVVFDMTDEDGEVFVGIDNVEFIYNSTDGEDKTANVSNGSSISVQYTANFKIKVTTVAGYTFKQITITADGLHRVFTSEDADEQGYISYTMPEYALNIKVEIENETYVITYHKNLNGDNTTTTQNVTYLEENVRLSEMFVQTGYTLLGWATSPESEEVIYELNDTIAVYDRTEGLDLYGVWEANKYTIKYNNNGGQGAIQDKEVSYDELVELDDHSTFTKTGFSFVGWSTSVEENTMSEVTNVDEIQSAGIFYVTSEDKYYAFNLAGDTVANSEIVIYAYWQPLKYNVKLAYEVGSDTTYDVGLLEYGKEYTLPAFNTLGWNNAGYEFSGWYYFDDEGERQEILCSVSETPTISNLTLVENKEVVIYTIWGKGMTSFRIRILLETLNGNYGASEGNYIDITNNVIETDSVVTSRIAYDDYIVGTQYENIQGFAFDSDQSDSQVISGAGTTTVLVYFERQSYKLTINKGENIESVSITTETNSHSIDTTTDDFVTYNVKYEDKVTMSLQEAEGYGNGYFEIDIPKSVAGATLEADGISLYMKGQQEGTQLAGDITVNTTAVANKDTRYTIQVYKQNLELEYDVTPSYTTYSTGETGAEIDEDAVRALVEGNETYDFSGFDYLMTTFENGNTILGDGSTVVKLYYTRNYYYVDLSIENNNAITTESTGGRFLFDEEVTFKFTLNKGYTLNKDTGFTIVDAEGEVVEGVRYTVMEEDNDIGTKDFTLVLRVPSQEISLSIKPETREDTAYTVVYLFQTTALGANYEEDSNYPSVPMIGETEHILTREDINYGSVEVAGFEIDHSSVDGNNVAIAGDGSTIVYIYYNRQEFDMTVTFVDEMNGMIAGSFKVLVNGVDATIIEGNTYSIAYGQTFEISFDIASGFTFGGFEVNDRLQIDNVDGTKLTYVMGTQNIVVKVTIIANENTIYNLEYYRQTLNNDSEELVFEKIFEVERRGITHQYFSPDTIKTNFVDNISDLPGYDETMFTGFDYSYYSVTIAGEDATAFAYISGDGSTVFKFYFIRKMINVSIDYNENQIESVSGQGSYAYGSEITVTATAKPGYKFEHWLIDGQEIDEPIYSFILDKEVDIEIVVVSTVGEANYTVEHYFEVLDSEYELRYSDEFTGVTESEVEIEGLLKVESGYEFFRTGNGEEPYIINGEGSTVVQIYYNLKTVTFTISYSSGISSVTVEGYNSPNDLELVEFDPVGLVYTYRSKYTKRLSLSVDPEPGYDLYGWVLNDNRTPEPNSNQLRGYLFDVRDNDFSLKAVAITKQITIRFNPNNGTSEVIEMQAYYNSTVRLRENTFRNGNMRFVGWANREGELLYFDGEEITIDFENDLDLYAVWEEQESSNWWIYILIGLLILLILIIIIILIIRKKKKEKEKIMSKQ